MAGALALVLAGAARHDAAGLLQHVTESGLVSEALEVAGAARQRVVQDEGAAPTAGLLIGHGGGYHGGIVGVAAVFRRDARLQRGGKGRRASISAVATGTRMRRASVSSLWARRTPACSPSRWRSGHQGRWCRGGIESRTDQRVLAAGTLGRLEGGTAAGQAGEERADPPLLSHEDVIRPPVRPGDAEVELADDCVPGVIHAEGRLRVPPRPGLDVTGVDVDSDRLLVVSPLPVVVIVGDPSVVAPVMRGDANGPDHLVQGAGVADPRVLAARAGPGVLGVETLTDEPAQLAHPPVLPRRSGLGADVEAGDVVPDLPDVEVIAGRQLGERLAGRAGVFAWLAVVPSTSVLVILLPGERGLQGGQHVDQGVVRQQPEVHQRAVGVGPADLADAPSHAAPLAGQLPLVAGAGPGPTRSLAHRLVDSR